MTGDRRRTRLVVVPRILQVPDLRRLLTAFAVFTVNEWATWIALLVYAHGVGGASAAGTAAVAMLVPTAILAPVFATAIDRLPRRTGLLIGYVGLAVLAMVTGLAMIAEARFAVVIAAGAAFTVMVSATRVAHGSAIPSLSADPSAALATTAIGGSIDGAGGLVGPLVAAGLLLTNPGILFLVMGALLTGSSAAVARMEGGRARVDRGPEHHIGPRRVASLLTRLDLASVIAIGGLSQLVLGAIDILLVVLAIEVLGLAEPGAGLLNSLFGAGSIVAGVMAMRLVGRPRLGRAIGSGAAAMGIPLMISAPFPIATLLFPIAGLGRTYADVAGRTLLHRLVPEDALGRVFGVLESLSMAGLAVGAGLAPQLIEWVGASGALVAVGLLMPLGYGVLWPFLRQADRQARVPEAAVRILRMVPDFALLDPVALERLALDSKLEPTTSGELIIREGEEGSVAWVVVDGRYRVSRRGRTVVELEPGEILGEIALLHATTRTADVTSIEDGTLLRLDRKAFLEAVSIGASDSHHISQLASRRLEQLEHIPD